MGMPRTEEVRHVYVDVHRCALSVAGMKHAVMIPTPWGVCGYVWLRVWASFFEIYHFGSLA